jgi:hypothetical protein
MDTFSTVFKKGLDRFIPPFVDKKYTTVQSKERVEPANVKAYAEGGNLLMNAVENRDQIERGLYVNF